ncbi:MAG: 3-phosphoshikimate 1-carboxyvinyltransferase [Lachnospiraceae bacterium]|nr:3-phosphoshikimate 1-carboxyvinyltransferase [Lachnospiraceae bacterium]
MNEYKVKHLKTKDIRVAVPGSKSITNRALLIAAMTKGKTKLQGVLFSDDSRHFLQALIDLGFEVNIDEEKKEVVVNGLGGDIPNKNAKVYVGSAGTAARFLTAYLALSEGTYVIDASEQMKKRPMKPLFDALISMGANIKYLENEGCLPIETGGNLGLKNEICLDISKSSQFLSALLMTGMLVKGGIKIHITSEKKTGSYIDITRKMMASFGKLVAFSEGDYYVSDEAYTGTTYQIEPDVSAACYFYAMAATNSCKALVYNVHFDSMQGDIRFVKLLETMGCYVEDTDEGIVVIGPETGKLKGVEVDMNNFSDQALTLAAIAPFANSPVTIKNVAHLRGQECDRLHAMASELTRMGIKCEESEDSIVIYNGDINPARIETYDDHRVAMSFAVTGLLGEGIVITNPMCCRKTFEEYFDLLDTLC